MINGRTEFDQSEMGMLVTDHIDAMLAYWDRNQVCRFANNAYREWFGKSKEEMINKITMKELLGPLYAMNLPYINTVLAGEKQVFEREIPLPGGDHRHSLAMYFPDVVNGEVRGFFVHVADVSHIKELESQLNRSRLEMVRTVIETQEKERAEIATNLRDNVNQNLVSCKLLLQEKIRSEGSTAADQKLIDAIDQAIGELKAISMNLIPSAIIDFGFITGMEEFLENFRSRYHLVVYFECDETVEDLSTTDKFSIFRIIQDFLMIIRLNAQVSMIRTSLQYENGRLDLVISIDDMEFELMAEDKDHRDILYRIENYGGTIETTCLEEMNAIKVSLLFYDSNGHFSNSTVNPVPSSN